MAIFSQKLTNRMKMIKITTYVNFSRKNEEKNIYAHDKKDSRYEISPHKKQEENDKKLLQMATYPQQLKNRVKMIK